MTLLSFESGESGLTVTLHYILTLIELLCACFYVCDFVSFDTVGHRCSNRKHLLS
jgi:hypothetical protein